MNNSVKKEWVYSGYGIELYGKSTLGFGHNYGKNIIVLGVDNSSSSHTDNCKNRFLVSDEGDTFDINGSFVAPEKNVKC